MTDTHKPLPTIPTIEHEAPASAVSLTSLLQELQRALSPESSIDEAMESDEDRSDAETEHGDFDPNAKDASPTAGSVSHEHSEGKDESHELRKASTLSQRRRGIDLSIFGDFKRNGFQDQLEGSAQDTEAGSDAEGSGSEPSAPSSSQSNVRSTDPITANQPSSRYSHSARGSQLEEERSQSSEGLAKDDVDYKPDSSIKGGEKSACTSVSRRTPLSPEVASSSGETNLARIQDGLKSLWATSAFTDLTIHCGHYAYPVHKNILASQSMHFADAIRNNVISTPNRPDVMTMHDDDPLALKSLLEFLYSGTLTVPLDSLLILGGPAMPSIEILERVYTLAIKYYLPDLRSLAVRQYGEALGTKWPRGHGLLIAKALKELFVQREDDGKDLEDLKEATLDVAVRFVSDLLQDRVVFDMLEGEPLRAIMGRLTSMVNGTVSGT